MDSTVVHSRSEEEEGQEKKSVLKKVKDKAKKIKQTIKAHAHDQDDPNRDDRYEHNQDFDLDEEDDEAVQDPEIHGAPIYESEVSLEKEADRTPVGLGTVLLEEDPHAPKASREQVEPENYEAKTADPTNSGGKEAEISRSLEEMKLEEERAEQEEQNYTEKVSSAINAAKDVVVDKVAPIYEKVSGTGARSMKEYIVEKLKPSEEDKMLSEVIAGKLQKKGEVKESEEVKDRLGSSEGGCAGKNSGEVKVDTGGSSSSRMVDRVKGAVSSWLGRSGEPGNEVRDETSQEGVLSGDVGDEQQQAYTD